jgi:hypothetical protein
MRPSTVSASGFRIALIAAMLSALSAQVGAPNGTTVQGANLNGWGLQGSSYQGQGAQGIGVQGGDQSGREREAADLGTLALLAVRLPGGRERRRWRSWGGAARGGWPGGSAQRSAPRRRRGARPRRCCSTNRDPATPLPDLNSQIENRAWPFRCSALNGVPPPQSHHH